MFTSSIDKDKTHVFSSSVSSSHHQKVFVFLIREVHNGYIVELLDIYSYPLYHYTRKEMVFSALNSFPNNHCWDGKKVHEEHDWVDYGYTKSRLLNTNVNCGHRGYVIASLSPQITPAMIETVRKYNLE